MWISAIPSWQISLKANHRHGSCLLEVKTTAVIGDSNAGKAYFISRPLQEICTFLGRLGSITSGSQFVWQECGNVRAVFIDEAQFPTKYLEKFKQMTAGKECSADKKHAGNVLLMRMPIYRTSNHDRWITDPTQETLLKTGCSVADVEIVKHG